MYNVIGICVLLRGSPRILRNNNQIACDFFWQL